MQKHLQISPPMVPSSLQGAPVADAGRRVRPVQKLLVAEPDSGVQGIDGDIAPGAGTVRRAKLVLLVQRQRLRW